MTLQSCVTIASLVIGILAGWKAGNSLRPRPCPMPNLPHESVPALIEHLTRQRWARCNGEVVEFLPEGSSPTALWFRDKHFDEHCVPIYAGGIEVLGINLFKVNKFGHWLTFDVSPIRKGAEHG